MLHPSLIERITRSLAYMLRHQPEQFDLELDEYGYADLDDVVAALNERLGEPVEAEDVAQAVEGGDRPRYEIREERIRALYGHSIQVKPGDPTKPPPLLYVGISKADAERARRYGLRPGRRSFLHLALTPEDALETGRRASRDYVVITVNALDAWEEGINFYDRKSLFLSDPIPTHFLHVGDLQTDGYGDEEGPERGSRPQPVGGPQREARSEPPRRREWRDRPPERHQERNFDRPPERSAERAPERSFERAAPRSAEGFAHAPAERAPDRTSERTSDRAPDRAPDRSSERPASERGGERPSRGESGGDRHGPRGRERHGRGDSRPPRGDRGPPRQDRDARPDRRDAPRGPAPSRERHGDAPHRAAPAAEPARAPSGGPAKENFQPPAPRPSSAGSDSFGRGVFEARPENRPAPARAPESRGREAPAREETAPPSIEKSRPPPPVEADDSGFGAGI